MTLREEFARDIFLADNSSFPEAAAQKDWDENREHHDYAFEIADRLIAKGYVGRVTRWQRSTFNQ